MATKVFVSYKYADNSVAALYGNSLYSPTTARDYVDKFIELVSGKDIVIYKGEKNDESLADFSNDYIWGSLKNRIYDSTLTIVFISPNMRERYKSEKDQWIPQEVSYSLRKQTRDGRTSNPNALLYVVLPDRCNSTFYRNRMFQFAILNKNEENGYAYVVEWNNFVRNVGKYIDMAKNNASVYVPVKQI